MNTPDTSARPQEARRLSGWKDIAQYLDKGIRTVQRWEKEHDLPVRRLPGKGGRAESVFAFTTELDEWLSSAAATSARWSLDQDGEDENGLGNGFENDGAGPDGAGRSHPSHPPPSGARPWLVAIIASGTTLVVVILAWWAWRTLGPSSAPGNPVFARVDADVVTAFDASGRVVWHHQFPAPLEMPDASTAVQFLPRDIVTIRDLDGDGMHEAVVAAILAPPHREDSAFYLIEADGRVRWVHRFAGQARFGRDLFDAPYLPFRVFVTSAPEGGTESTIWLASVHGQLFPTVLQRVDPRTGQASGKYWSNGYIDTLSLTQMGERPVLLAGGCNNETKGASLAVLDALHLSGSAPATDPAYACTSCGPGWPMRFIVFPKPPRFAPIDSASGVVRLEVGPNDIVAGVQHAITPDRGANAMVFYRLTPELVPIDAQTGDGYLQTSAALTRALLIPPGSPTTVDPDREFFPLLQWDGRTFVPLPLLKPH